MSNPKDKIFKCNVTSRDTLLVETSFDDNPFLAFVTTKGAAYGQRDEETIIALNYAQIQEIHAVLGEALKNFEENSK